MQIDRLWDEKRGGELLRHRKNDSLKIVKLSFLDTFLYSISVLKWSGSIS